MNRRMVVGVGLVAALLASFWTRGGAADHAGPKPRRTVDTALREAAVADDGFQVGRKERRRWRLAIPDPRYETIARALAAIDARLDIPIVLPSGLEDWRLGPRPAIYFHAGSAQLDIRRGPRKILIVQFGRAGFDGCGGDSAVPVTIGRQPGMANESKGADGSDRYVWSSVIWPATRKNLMGRYGLSGTFTKKAIVEMARSMERARVAMMEDLSPGC
jgi:hypothetical protein